MEISITIEATLDLNWSLWKRLIERIEALGFAGLYRSDHFMVGKPGSDSLELVTSLTYLADHTQRLHFGSLVSPLSFHHPVMLARQAMAINDLSGGRMILGVGSGWHEEEHTMFGYQLGDKKTRLDRLEEGLQVISALVRQDEPFSFEGKHFQLKNAQLVPRSPVRILVGGNGPTRTLPLVARYADIWNCQVAEPAAFNEINQNLDRLIESAGRQPGDVKRTVMIPVLCLRTEGDLQRQISLLQQHAAPFRDYSAEEIKAWLYSLKGIIGSPQQVVDGLAAYAKFGVRELIIQWFGLHDQEGLELLGSEVLPQFHQP
jgi:alkanesulfonate monooxygenase SsuD/methylene tetrahydromethanopterin reductase-like flavin-dependent oxidoreductase (luciferase family)